MNALERYREAIRMDEAGEKPFSYASFSFGKYRLQLLGRYWFWIDDDKGREWEYASDSWDGMFALCIHELGMTLAEVMEKTPADALEFE